VIFRTFDFGRIDSVGQYAAARSTIQCAPLHRRFRVLLVEDNPADIRLLQEAFSQSPGLYELHTVMDGEAAMDFIYRRNEHADKARPDLILLDINLPKRDGHDVLQTVKGTPGLVRIPVLMLTSSDSSMDVAKAYDRHANAYIRNLWKSRTTSR
jgi:CheY-like chemotaxis protein